VRGNIFRVVVGTVGKITIFVSLFSGPFFRPFSVFQSNLPLNATASSHSKKFTMTSTEVIDPFTSSAERVQNISAILKLFSKML
jgi:hypothetical protein